MNTFEFMSNLDKKVAENMKNFFRSRYGEKETGILSLIEKGGYYVVVFKGYEWTLPAEGDGSIYSLGGARRVAKEKGASYISLKKYVEILKKGGWL